MQKMGNQSIPWEQCETERTGRCQEKKNPLWFHKVQVFSKAAVILNVTKVNNTAVYKKAVYYLDLQVNVTKVNNTGVKLHKGCLLSWSPGERDQGQQHWCKAPQRLFIILISRWTWPRSTTLVFTKRPFIILISRWTWPRSTTLVFTKRPFIILISRWTWPRSTTLVFTKRPFIILISRWTWPRSTTLV